MKARGTVFVGLVTLVAMLVMSNGAMPVSAATLCVGGGGCYSTIQAAINAAGNGDTITVAAGTYSEALAIATPNLHIIGAGEGVVTIDVTGKTGGSLQSGISVTASGVTLEGFTLSSNGASPPRYGIKFSNTTNGTLKNITVHHLFRSGVDMASVSGMTIDHVTSYNNGGNGLGLRDISNSTIKNVTTHDNAWGGVRIQTYYGSISGVVVSGTNSFGESASANGGLYLEEGNAAHVLPVYAISYGYGGTPDVLLQIADFAASVSGTQDDAAAGPGDQPYNRIRFYQTVAQAEAALVGTPDHLVAGTGYVTINSAVEVGDQATVDTNLTVSGLYGAQLVLDHDNAVLNFVSGVTNSVPSASPPWSWDIVAKSFTHPAVNQTELAGSMRGDLHPDGAVLTGQSIATWTYQCAAVGTSGLTYDTAALTGTLLSDKNGGALSATLTEGLVSCVAATGSITGTIALQGRVQGAADPAGWNDAVVTLTCADSSGGCTGYGPYTFTTDNHGVYVLTKSGVGSGVVAGNYTASVTRRAYLGATKASPVSVTKDGTTTITGPTPPMLGGDVDDSGTINVVDLSTIGTAFGQAPVGGADTGADVNGDSIVNIFDLVLAGGNYNLTTSTWP